MNLTHSLLFLYKLFSSKLFSIIKSDGVISISF